MTELSAETVVAAINALLRVSAGVIGAAVSLAFVGTSMPWPQRGASFILAAVAAQLAPDVFIEHMPTLAGSKGLLGFAVGLFAVTVYRELLVEVPDLVRAAGRVLIRIFGRGRDDPEDRNDQQGGSK